MLDPLISHDDINNQTVFVTYGGELVQIKSCKSFSEYPWMTKAGAQYKGSGVRHHIMHGYEFYNLKERVGNYRLMQTVISDKRKHNSPSMTTFDNLAIGQLFESTDSIWRKISNDKAECVVGARAGQVAFNISTFSTGYLVIPRRDLKLTMVLENSDD